MNPLAKAVGHVPISPAKLEDTSSNIAKGHALPSSLNPRFVSDEEASVFKQIQALDSQLQPLLQKREGNEARILPLCTKIAELHDSRKPRTMATVSGAAAYYWCAFDCAKTLQLANVKDIGRKYNSLVLEIQTFKAGAGAKGQEEKEQSPVTAKVGAAARSVVRAPAVRTPVVVSTQHSASPSAAKVQKAVL